MHTGTEKLELPGNFDKPKSQGIVREFCKRSGSVQFEAQIVFSFLYFAFQIRASRGSHRQSLPKKSCYFDLDCFVSWSQKTYNCQGILFFKMSGHPVSATDFPQGQLHSSDLLKFNIILPV